MAQSTIMKVLAANVAAGGTIAFDYPAGKSADDFAGGDESWISSISRNPQYQKNSHFTIAFGASAATVSLVTGGYTKGETVFLHLDQGDIAQTVAAPEKMSVLTPVKINLGAPIASDGDGAVASQACTAASGLATGINGALAASGVATFDVPRNVVAAWTTAAVLTVTGTDYYGNVIVESSGSGTSMTGKKAFKTITGIASSVDITGLTVGTSKVLGLPAYLGDAADILSELEDEAGATAGTRAAGVTDAATATTGDVRGTYAPNSAPDGTKVFELVALMRDPTSKGIAQYAG